MNKTIILLFMALLALSCQPSQTQGDVAQGDVPDSTAISENGGSTTAPGMLPGQIVDRQLVIAPADFQPQSAARELAQVLAGSSPAGKSVQLGYMTFEQEAVVFPEEGEAAREIDELAVIMREHPALFVDVAVYARGGERLAIQRAFFIKNRLIEDMVDPERIDTQGFPADNGGERVEVRVIRN